MNYPGAVTSPAPSSSPAILIARFHVRPGAEGEFAAWQAKALTRAAGCEGFANSELTPATASDSAWTVSLRFCNAANLEDWRNSTDWHGLIGEVQHFLAPETAVEIEAKEAGPDGGVVEVIVTKVKPGMEAAYRQWETRIQQAQSRFPGYKGSYVQPPIAGELGWTTLMRFDTAQQLEQWLKSPQRAALLVEAQPLIDYAHLQRMDSSFPGWFPTDPDTGRAPPNWKAAMLVLLGLFPIVMLETRFLSPRLAGLNSSVAMFFGNIISVALTTWLTMPVFIKALSWWLFPRSGKSTVARNAAGTALIFALFAAEVAALWHLL